MVVLVMVLMTLHCNGGTWAVTTGCPQIVLMSLMLETQSETDNWQALNSAILDPQTKTNDITHSF